MKLLTSPILYTHSDNWIDQAFVGKEGTRDCRVWWFCAAEFCEYFDVPAEATKVWLEFHTTPASDRYKAESLLGWLYLDGEYTRVMQRVVAMIVRQLKTTSCYVECHYA